MSVVIARGCTVVTDAYTQVTFSVTFKLIGRKRLTRRIICNNRPLNAMIHRFQGPVDNDPSTVLSNTNSLLSVVGISTKKVTSMGELTRVASSMFVAVFESLFHVRLEGIIRNPQNKDEYAHNAQRVIDRLRI